MAHSFTVRFRDQDGAQASLSGQLPDTDVALLSEFIEHGERLEQTAFVHGMGSANLSIEWSAQEGFRVEADLPERSVFAEFIHELRPFILQDEPTYFYKVAGIFGRAFTHPQLRSGLRMLSDLFSGRRSDNIVGVVAGDRRITSDEFVRDWLNAYEFHRVPAIRQQIEGLHAEMPLEATEAVVVQLLIDKANAIRQLRAIGTSCLNGDGASFTITPD